jgi:hypothetical protein
LDGVGEDEAEALDLGLEASDLFLGLQDPGQAVADMLEVGLAEPEAVAGMEADRGTLTSDSKKDFSCPRERLRWARATRRPMRGFQTSDPANSGE